MMQDCNYQTLFLAFIGLLVLINFLLNRLWGVLQAIRAILGPYFIASEENSSLIQKFGSWALITGCTDGIGKAYAKELAKRGINIVLVSRNKEKLENTAREIESEFSVKTKIIVADFSQGVKAVETVKSEIGGIPIGILVNNVGKNYEYPMYLNEVPEEELWDVININVGAVTMLCRAFIWKMKKNGRGAIVNVSSGSELQPLPLMTVYAATKSYIKSFTTALRYEYRNSGLTIQHLSPFFINTKMNQFSERFQRTNFIVPDAEMYAKYAVATLGKQDKSTGFWAHGIQAFFIEIIPEWLRMEVGGLIMRGLRREYLEKNNLKSK
ncbi:hypothetical protein WA026_003468 [Henosepilachna vigintioctopunctata]|uniref:Inactive hydroxysteroid dehydrogenase-like protein 1 n=1 Tax=Henosepilachna vigintioctopunctata TaxID=420089 RepID=A0AAW1TPQ4_9CUCU